MQPAGKDIICNKQTVLWVFGFNTIFFFNRNPKRYVFIIFIYIKLRIVKVILPKSRNCRCNTYQGLWTKMSYYDDHFKSFMISFELKRWRYYILWGPHLCKQTLIYELSCVLRCLDNITALSWRQQTIMTIGNSHRVKKSDFKLLFRTLTLIYTKHWYLKSTFM